MVEVEEVGFDAVGGGDGGTPADVDGAFVFLLVLEECFSGVDACGGMTLVFGLDVDGGEAEAVAALVAFDNFSVEGEWAAEHLGGESELAGLDAFADAAAADGFFSFGDACGDFKL